MALREEVIFPHRAISQTGFLKPGKRDAFDAKKDLCYPKTQ